MRRRAAGFRHSLMRRMFAVFLLTVVPILLGCLAVYHQGSNLAWQRGLRLVDAEQNYLLETIDRELTNISVSQLELTLDGDITYMINMDGVLSDYWHYRNISDMLDQLNQIARNNYWITQIRLHIPSMGKTLTSDLDLQPLMEECGQLAARQNNVSIFYSMLDGHFCIVSCNPLLKGEEQYYIVTQLRFEQLAALLPPTLGSNGVQLYLGTGDGRTFFSYNEDAGPAPSGLADAAGQARRVTLDGKNYIARRDPLFYGQLQLVMLLPEKALGAETDAYRLTFELIGLGSIVLVACLSWVFYRQVNRPVHELAQGCEQVRDGKLTFDVPPMRTSEFQLLSDGFSTMLGRIRKLIDENYRQKILVQQMELKQLHAKVNPHFLHNSLLNIRAMAQLQDYEGIEDMTEKLSKFYLYATRTHREIVAAREEYEYTQLYIDIQSVRFGERIQAQVEPLPEDCAEVGMPRFILQNLVENAYKYGVPAQGAGLIRLRCESQRDAVYFRVEDNGTQFDEEKLRVLREIIETEREDGLPGTGLMNIALRLKLHYGQSGLLRLERSALGGLCATVVIPRAQNGDKSSGQF